MIRIDITPIGAKTFAGSNVSQREYVTQAKKNAGSSLFHYIQGI
jgi:hypothetical protein